MANRWHFPQVDGSPASAPAAPGGSGGQAADVDELAATLGRRDAAGGETEASSGLGTAAKSARVVGGRWRDAHPTGLKATEPAPTSSRTAQPAAQDQRRVRRRVDILADCRLREPVHAAASRHGGHLALMTCTVPAKPRWLLAIPDAISQLEQLDRTLLTRRDIEHLFGVSKVRGAALMKTFGAEMTGNLRTLPRTKLLQQLKKHRGRAAFRGEEERRARLVAELQKARLTGVRFKVPAETMSAQLANLPEGVSVARGRIEVRFDGAEDALARLFALAQALGNDYVRFEELVGR